MKRILTSSIFILIVSVCLSQNDGLGLNVGYKSYYGFGVEYKHKFNWFHPAIGVGYGLYSGMKLGTSMAFSFGKNKFKPNIALGFTGATGEYNQLNDAEGESEVYVVKPHFYITATSGITLSLNRFDHCIYGGYSFLTSPLRIDVDQFNTSTSSYSKVENAIKSGITVGYSLIYMF